MVAADDTGEQRLFVAVIPPPPVLDELATLARPEHPDIRWTTREQWHITLRFLGRTEVGPASRALDELIAEPAQVVLGPRVEPLGRHVAVVPATGLDTVAIAVAAATDGLGDPAPDRSFVGHLTVARARGRSRLDPAILGAPVDASFTAGEVHLVASQLHPDGARYTILTSRTLASPGGSTPGAARPGQATGRSSSTRS